MSENHAQENYLEVGDHASRSSELELLTFTYGRVTGVIVGGVGQCERTAVQCHGNVHLRLWRSLLYPVTDCKVLDLDHICMLCL